MKFKIGEVVKSKTDSCHRIVIIWPKKIKIFGFQRYRVSWFAGGEYHFGTAYEQELEINN